MARKAKSGLPEWLRAVETASTQRSHPQELEAADRFEALTSSALKMALVREIVATRASELTLAYRNVVMVAAGYKSRCSPSGIHELYPEPCVIFVVKRKWAPGSKGQAGQLLPQRLLTIAGTQGDRKLYAVPTDVQPARWFYGGAARAASCVLVDDPVPAFRLPGTLTCGVRLKGAAPGMALALSAMHVLSPVPARIQPAGGAVFTAVGTPPRPRGKSTVWGGHLDFLGDLSAFDAQLGKIDDIAWFTQAFKGIALSATFPFVSAPDVFDDLAATNRFLILAPDNHPNHLGAPREPMLAQFWMTNGGAMPLDYQVRIGASYQTIALRHNELIMFQVSEDSPVPECGDSGSAVISWWPDGSAVLVGMFIGSSVRLVHVIPAWQLFDPQNWRGRLPAGTIALTPCFSLP